MNTQRIHGEGENTREILEKTLMSKHSLHAEAEALSSLETGSSVPAFRTMESRRPKWVIVSMMADFAMCSFVMSH